MVIPVALMISETSKGLFSLVARSVQGFLRTCHPESLTIEVDSGTEARRTFDLGFTFSHAVDQLNINSGTLIRWSKGFDISGVVGQDICALLQTELTELALPVRVTALINDTVGTLMARSYASPESAHTVLGAVFGTGTNGAYVEKASKITKLNGSKTEGKGIMIVNSEWGNFDQNLEYLPTTAYDEVIDVKSVNPGFEMFEKRISGMYLGELLRLVLLSLIKDPKVDLLATSTIPETSKLYVQWGLDSSFLSYLESDSTPDLSPSVAELEQWTGITNATIEDVKALRIISHAIGRRSARLSAVALGAVILQTNCLGEDGGRVDIGVDGSLIELYPGFLDEMRETLRSIPRIGDGEKMVDIVVAKDGSGVGAALAAHIAARHLNC
jgi:hexokinase